MLLRSLSKSAIRTLQSILRRARMEDTLKDDDGALKVFAAVYERGRLAAEAAQSEEEHAFRLRLSVRIISGGCGLNGTPLATVLLRSRHTDGWRDRSGGVDQSLWTIGDAFAMGLAWRTLAQVSSEAKSWGTNRLDGPLAQEFGWTVPMDLNALRAHFEAAGWVVEKA